MRLFFAGFSHPKKVPLDKRPNGDFSISLVNILSAQEDIYHLVPAFLGPGQFIEQKGYEVGIDTYFIPENSIKDISYSQFSKKNLYKGRYPLNIGEIAISGPAARGHNLSVGDEVTIQSCWPHATSFSLPARIVGIYSLMDSGSAVVPVSKDDLYTLTYNYNKSLEEIFIQSGYLEDYPLLKNITCNWMWVTTNRNETEMHNLLDPHFPEDNPLLILSRNAQEQQAVDWLEFTPPAVTVISLIGLIALSILCHREAVSSKQIYEPVQALLGTLGAKQATLRIAITLYEGVILLFSLAVAYFISVNYNVGLFFGMYFPGVLRPLLMQALVAIFILVLGYIYFCVIVRTRKQLNVLSEYRWEL